MVWVAANASRLDSRIALSGAPHRRGEPALLRVGGIRERIVPVPVREVTAVRDQDAAIGGMQRRCMLLWCTHASAQRMNSPPFTSQHAPFAK